MKSTLENSPKTFDILPKWRYFSESNRTAITLSCGNKISFTFSE